MHRPSSGRARQADDRSAPVQAHSCVPRDRAGRLSLSVRELRWVRVRSWSVLYHVSGECEQDEQPSDAEDEAMDAAAGSSCTPRAVCHVR
mgnify:CR=1 FL=1